MKHSISHVAIAAFLASIPVSAVAQESSKTAADDQIVVTATRAEGGIPRDQLGGSVTLFSAQDLEERQVTLVSDLLRDSPGIAVSRTGPIGTQTQVRIRGAEGNHTLVLVDGMDVSDPYIQEFDFSSLIADDIARVEVLRGQQSSLYGSGAIGGVIQYFTATGKEKPGLSGRFEYGSNNTTEESARFAGVNGDLDYAISGNVYSTDGVPSAPNGDRDLSFDNTAGSIRLGYQVTPALSLTGIVRGRSSQGEYNSDTDANGLQLDNPGYHYEDEAIYALARANLDLGNWTQALTVQGVDGKRRDFTPGSFFGDTTGADASRFAASYVTTYHFAGEHLDQNITGAIDYKRDEFSTFNIPEQHIANTGYVLQYDGVLDQRLAFGASVRQDVNDRFDDSTTYRVQGSYAFDQGTRIRAAFGSGVKNPIMTELFGFGGRYQGSPNLRPEESIGWEAGIEQKLFDDAALIGITYFDSTLKHEIVLDFSAFPLTSSKNLTTESTQQGVEVFANAKIGEQINVDFAYTYLDAEQNKVTEVRRAENIASLNVGWRTLDDRGGLNLNVRYNGEQNDNQFLFSAPFVRPVTLDAFTLVNVGADWKVTDKIQVYGRVENALDEDYQEVFGYATAGATAYIGVRAAY